MARPILCLIWALWLLPAGWVPADEPQSPPTVSGARPVLGAGPASQPAESATTAAPPGTTTTQPAPAVPGFEQRRIGGARDEGAAGAEAGLGGWLGSTWWAMLVVIGLVFLAAWALKRWAPGPLGGRQGGPFRLLSRWHLSAKQYIALIQLGRRMMLVGVTGQQMSLLAEITDPGEIEQLLASCPSGRSILAEGFGQLLGRHRREMSEAEEAGGSGGSAQRAAGQLGRLVGQVKSRLTRLKSGRDQRE